MPHDALERINTTRLAHVVDHDHTTRKDDEHTDGYLAQLGLFYETGDLTAPVVVSGKVPQEKAQAIKALPEAERLTEAAALYQAECDRLLRRIKRLRKRIDTLTNPNMRRVPRG